MPSTISFKGDIVGYLASSQTNLDPIQKPQSAQTKTNYQQIKGEKKENKTLSSMNQRELHQR
jgi:hypothetical protein